MSRKHFRSIENAYVLIHVFQDDMENINTTPLTPLPIEFNYKSHQTYPLARVINIPEWGQKWYVQFVVE